MNNLVSILMPIYNNADTVAIAINSVIAQSYKFWELVIVNDGSTDNLIDVLDKYKDETRIRVIHQENHGRGYTRNVALNSAKGDYIAFLDADDFIHNEKIMMQINDFVTHPELSMTSCQMLVYVDSCKVATTTQTNDINIRGYNINDKLNISCATIMFKKDIGINYNLKLDVGEDIDFIKRYLIGKKYLIKNDVLYYYNLSELTKIKMIDYSKKVLNNNWLIINNDFTICNFRAFLFSLLRICYYSIFPLSFIIKKRYTTNADEKLINEFSSLKSKYNEI